MEELPDTIYEQIKEHCKAGDDLLDEQRYKEAREQYWNAFDLLPEPQNRWDAASWILASIGDSFFVQGDFENGKRAFEDASHCPDGLGNPFVHMRLGQCYFELGDRDRAADQLA